MWSAYTSQSVIPEHVELDVTAPNKRITRCLKEMDIDVIDLMENLKAAGEKNPYLYFPTNCH